MNVLRSPELLHRDSSRLLLVDVQEKLVSALDEATQKRFLETCRFLGEGARIMGILVHQKSGSVPSNARACQPLLMTLAFKLSSLEWKHMSACCKQRLICLHQAIKRTSLPTPSQDEDRSIMTSLFNEWRIPER